MSEAEERCLCGDARRDNLGRVYVFYHARFVHGGRWPGYGRCYATGCRCLSFRASELQA